MIADKVSEFESVKSNLEEKLREIETSEEVMLNILRKNMDFGEETSKNRKK